MHLILKKIFSITAEILRNILAWKGGKFHFFRKFIYMEHLIPQTWDKW
jgi:hypothetical protein